MSDDLKDIRHVVLDMDGTIYLGNSLFASTRPFLSLLDELEIGYTFITNNNSRDRAAYARHLQELGIEVAAEKIFSSAHATIHYLQDRLPEVKRLFVVGTEGLVREFHQAGFQSVEDEPQAVVVGFDLNLAYDRLCRAAYWISKSLPYIATHPDRICPTDKEIVLPDCGAVCALLEAATGRSPDAVPGKPNALMLDGVRRQGDFRPDEIAVVGDRIYTDIRMARDAGALAILTLTGETVRPDLATVPAESRPNLVIDDLGDLTSRLLAVHRPLKGSSRT